MKRLKTEYSIELGIDDMLNLLEKNIDNNLCSYLRRIPGVAKVMYDEGFGPILYVTLEDDFDNSETWRLIKDIVAEYVSNDIELSGVKDPWKIKLERTIQSSHPPPNTDFITQLQDGSVYRVVVERLQ